ncbi:10 TM acyl transferase domain found in Cas1p-domain-containing protein [Terfezia claveryi]|nr:10 TM acyl transferase domain found in Cas1p-domain-containing protein [Terfezia claveryi]
MVRLLRPSSSVGKVGSEISNHLFTILASFLTLAVIVRYCWHDSPDPFKCNALLQKGHWLDHPASGSEGVPKIWQTPGCTIRHYKSKDIQSCLEDKRLLFVGDSTIRQVFWAMAISLDPKFDSSLGDKHSDQVLTDGGVKLEFIWDPWLNGSRLNSELEAFVESGESAAVLLAGAGLWHSKYVDVNPGAHWKASIDNVLEHMKWAKTTVLRPRSDLLLLAPVTVPAWNKLTAVKNGTTLRDEVDMMNNYLKKMTHAQGADVFWAFNKFTEDLPQTFDESGIHNVQSIANLKADALLNLRCNSERAQYPVDGTCCNVYKAPNYLQWVALIGTFALSIVSLIVNDDRTPSASTAPLTVLSRLRRMLPLAHNHAAPIVFGLAMILCYYADRTQVLSKSHKHYLGSESFGMVIVTILLGLFTIRKTSTDPRTAEAQPFLGRDQTDEWKGWMQFVILIYHYTGASKIAWIYEIIRLLVASYLFMTGYGHTIYFYKKKDFSLKRVAGVLIRLNLLSLALPYMMGTDYLFYYFAPLVSYWFIVVYLTMWVGHKYNVNTKFLLVKIGVSALLTTGFTMKSGILEGIFGLLKAVAKVDWKVTEWRFRVFLDMWIVYVGMLVAIVFIKLSNPSSPIANRPRWPMFEHTAVILSAMALPGYIYYQSTFPNKFAYNESHPYVSFIPIVAFIILRNATPTLRNTYIGAYSWLGKCSLETFTLQFHIWMAADTKALLDYGIFGSDSRWLNFTISTILFVYVSNGVANATGELTSWIMGIQIGEGHEVQKPSGPRVPRMPRMPVLPTNAKDAVEMQPLAGKADGEANGSRAKPGPVVKEENLRLPIKLAGWLLLMWFMNLTY